MKWRSRRSTVGFVTSESPKVGFRPGPGVLAHRRGRLMSTPVYIELSTGVNSRQTSPMAPQVNTDDLIDAIAVADVLGLSQRTSVSVYQRRYPEMPRPVVDL